MKNLEVIDIANLDSVCGGLVDPCPGLKATRVDQLTQEDDAILKAKCHFFIPRATRKQVRDAKNTVFFAATKS